MLYIFGGRVVANCPSCRRFFDKAGFEHVLLLSADGALEAAPAMGAADIILDLVSTGVTLRENNLKTVKGGEIMDVRIFPEAPLIHTARA